MCQSIYALSVFLLLCAAAKIPVRLNIGLMLFAACFVSYMLRVNMSINILAMVKSSSYANATAPVDIDVSAAFFPPF